MNAHTFRDRAPLSELKAEGFDRVFLILHGPFGEDGTVQGALQVLGLPYTGCGVLASAIGMDKLRKLIWKALGLPIPDFALLDDNTDFAAVEQQLGLPIFVKPATEGSSIGVTKVKQPGQLRAAYEEASKYDKVVLAEQFIGGGEYTAAVLEQRNAAVREDRAGNRVLRLSGQEYFRDDTVYRCPSGLSAEREAEIGELVQRRSGALAAVAGAGWIS